MKKIEDITDAEIEAMLLAPETEYQKRWSEEMKRISVFLNRMDRVRSSLVARGLLGGHDSPA